jgi:membrane-bound lytic murein transglycosylase D
VPPGTRLDGSQESPASPPDNNFFVENQMVADLPARQKMIQAPTAATGVIPETEPAVSRKIQTQPATPAASSPPDKPEIVIENLVVQKAWVQNGKRVGVIRVDVEETLGHYAEWLNVSAREIRQLNGLRYGRALHMNQKLKIPLHRVTREEFVEKRFEYHQELAEDFFASYRVEKVRTYSIKRGDNIWTLSRQEFEVPLWLIKRYNAGVDFSSLVPSQKLIIPIIEKNV